MDYRDEIERALFFSMFKTDDLEKAQMLKEAVTKAEKLGDLDLLFKAKSAYMTAIAFTGNPEQVLALFPWLLAQCDKYPGRFNESEVLWYYKWVAIELPLFHTISRDRIFSIMADMEQRYVKAGYGKKVVYEFLRHIYMCLGEKKEMKKYHELFQAIEGTSEVSDCPACVLNKELDYWFMLGDYETLLERAKPILSGEMTCHAVPRSSYPKTILSTIYLDQFDKARDFHIKSIELLDHRQPYIIDYASNMLFLLLSRNFKPALEILSEHLGYVVKSMSQFHAHSFYIVSNLLLDVIEKEGKQSEVSLNLPKEFIGYQASGVYQTAELAKVFMEEAKRVEGLFNHRNQNEFFTEKRNEILALRSRLLDDILKI